MRPPGALIVVLLVVLGLTGLNTAAQAAATNLYLRADGAPNASMSLQTPGSGPPGTITLAPSSAGAGETDPAKYQRWTYDMSGLTGSVNNLVIWVLPENPDGERPIAFGVYVMDCAQTCTVLTTNSKTFQANQTWSKVTIPVKTGLHQFDAGHSLVVKVTVLGSSPQNVSFAYGSVDFSSALHLSALSTTSTTTTSSTTTTTVPTTTTTTSPTTTTTVPATTTTTIVSTTTIVPATTTTVPATTTTTRPRPSTTLATTTTTTIAGTTTTTTEQLVVGGPPTTPPSSIAGLDFGEVMPEMVTLSGSVDMPDEPTGVSKTATRARLRPAERLGVVFASVSETFSLYWEVAVALGLLMSILLMIGFANLEVPRPAPDTSERIRRIR